MDWIVFSSNLYRGFLGDSGVKNLPANAGEADSIPGSEDPLEEGSTAVFLPGKSHGGLQPRDHKRDTTEHAGTNLYIEALTSNEKVLYLEVGPLGSN